MGMMGTKQRFVSLDPGPSLSQVLGHRLGSRSHMEFLVNVADMRVDGGVGHLHGLRDFLVQKTFRQQVQHFRLARRQALRLSREPLAVGYMK